MTNLCETCKHWTKEAPDEYGANAQAALGLGKCNKARMFWDSTEWDEDGERQFIHPITTKAFVQDGSDYVAYLYTMPDFGCVQHEATPTDPKTVNEVYG